MWWESTKVSFSYDLFIWQLRWLWSLLRDVTSHTCFLSFLVFLQLAFMSPLFSLENTALFNYVFFFVSRQWWIGVTKWLFDTGTELSFMKQPIFSRDSPQSVLITFWLSICYNINCKTLTHSQNTKLTLSIVLFTFKTQRPWLSCVLWTSGTTTIWTLKGSGNTQCCGGRRGSNWEERQEGEFETFLRSLLLSLVAVYASGNALQHGQAVSWLENDNLRRCCSHPCSHSTCTNN